MTQIDTNNAIDVHAYLDESRISPADLDILARDNDISHIIISPPCTKNHEPDKHPAMYWIQRLLLKTGLFRIFAAWISNSFYNNKGELRAVWRLFTRESKDLIKVMHPDNSDLLKKISLYQDKLKMWYWINPEDDIDIVTLEEAFTHNQVFGLKIHAYWHNVDLCTIEKYVQFCKKVGCPLYVILGYGKAGEVSPLIKLCEGVNVILGYGAFPSFSLAWKKIQDHDNFYIDLTSFHLDRSLIRSALKTLGSEKCIFGTDCPYNFYDDAGNFSYKKTFQRITFEFLLPDDYDNIFRNNIKKISRYMDET
jgi:predicted TIM-barrel fold metal-dependent hydrolase